MVTSNPSIAHVRAATSNLLSPTSRAYKLVTMVSLISRCELPPEKPSRRLSLRPSNLGTVPNPSRTSGFITFTYCGTEWARFGYNLVQSQTTEMRH
ncbi:hypothetical protein M758_12G034000 [Ceratodon purpureus]|nr:hypothetical protein M758_12G034000 [Ceratodon purpureus]